MADDLREQCEAAVKKLSGVASRLGATDDADQIKSANSEATRYVRDADAAIRKLEAEARAAGPSQRRELMEQIAQLKASLQAVRSALQKANDGKARAALMKPADRSAAIERDARDKLESAAEKSSLSTQRLQQASQALAETQDIGVSVMDTMTAQRETLLRATSKAANTNDLTYQARGIMRLMQARAFTNKALLLLTVFVLLGAIGVVLYFGLTGHGNRGKAT